MNVKQKRRYDMIARVDRFGIAHAGAFPHGSVGRQLFAALRESLARLPNECAAQAAGRNRAREGTANKAAARESLYAALSSINRTARALAIDRPGLRGKFRLPSQESDEALVAAARAFAGDAKRWAPVFVAYGLRAGFVDGLHAAVTRFEHAIAERAAGRRAHVAARAGIDAALADSFVTVRRLDAVVFNVLGDDVAALEGWRRARRVVWRRTSKDRRPRRPKARLTVIQPDHAEMRGTRP
jgi:hypothetical protein